MATKIIIEAEVDTGNSVNDLELIEQGIDDVVGASKGISSAEKAFNDLNKKIDAGGLSMKELQQATKQYQTIALQAGADSPIGQAAIQKAGDLKDELKSLSEQVARVGDGGRNMQAALQLGGTIVAGYTAFQSVTAMLGAENEDLLKIITKLQAAQGALAAIEQIRAALEKESFLMLKLKNIQLAIQTEGYKKLFLQIIKNPYVAIGAAIAGVIGLMSALTSKESEYQKAVKYAKEEVDKLITAIDKRNKITIRGLDDEIALLKAAGKETFEQEQEKLRLIIKTTHAKVESLKAVRELEKIAHQQEITELQESGRG